MWLVEIWNEFGTCNREDWAPPCARMTRKFVKRSIFFIILCSKYKHYRAVGDWCDTHRALAGGRPAPFSHLTVICFVLTKRTRLCTRLNMKIVPGRDSGRLPRRRQYANRLWSDIMTQVEQSASLEPIHNTGSAAWCCYPELMTHFTPPPFALPAPEPPAFLLLFFLYISWE